MASRFAVPTPYVRSGESERIARSDPRWQLVDRILLTGPFQKSTNLHALLSYLADHSIRNETAYLTERQIGISVFGKPGDYSPAEDSAVRVHVRQLRLRLHEYFALDGRHEELIAEIPKGSYVLEFHPAETEIRPAPAPVLPQPEIKKKRRFLNVRDGLLAIATIAAVFFGIAWYRATHSANPGAPWPLNAVMQPDQDTHVVVSDGNSMLRLLGDHEITLEQYLEPGFRSSLIPKHTDENIARLLTYISDSQLTSYADLTVTASLLRLGGAHAHVLINSARDVNEREMEDGNYIFLGSPTSDPWVSLYTDQLNFQLVEDGVGGKIYFRNRKPLPGEQSTYEGLVSTGSAGEDYATISLVPATSGRGRVMILQGLRQEGTEALGFLLAHPNERAQLMSALGIQREPKSPVYFEALVRARAIAGAPVSINIVATRRISVPGQNH